MDNLLSETFLLIIAVLIVAQILITTIMIIEARDQIKDLKDELGLRKETIVKSDAFDSSKENLEDMIQDNVGDTFKPGLRLSLNVLNNTYKVQKKAIETYRDRD